MFWHHHDHGGGAASAQGSPTLPPPVEGSGELTFLVPADVQLRFESSRLQMWLEGPEAKEEPPVEEAAPASEEAPLGEKPTPSEEPAAPEEASAAEELPDSEEAPSPVKPSATDEPEATEESPAPEQEPAPEEPPVLVFDWREVSLVRLFPLSEPERWVAVITHDGREVGILLDVAELPPDAREAAREELRRRYMVPEIRRIVSVRERYDLVEWMVETDRGQVTFLTRNLREQVKRPFPHRLVLMDVEGNRYDVPDIEALDPESRHLLEDRT
jgi:hypothetical protein